MACPSSVGVPKHLPTLSPLTHWEGEGVFFRVCFVWPDSALLYTRVHMRTHAHSHTHICMLMEPGFLDLTSPGPLTSSSSWDKDA